MYRKRKLPQTRIEDWYEYSDYSSAEEEEVPVPGQPAIPALVNSEANTHQDLIEANDFIYTQEEEDEDEYLSDIAVESEDEYWNQLNELAKQWLLLELHHKVSKTAVDAFWRLAIHLIPKLIESKKLHSITRKIPQFQQLRRKMFQHNLPKLDLELSYRNNSTGEVSNFVSPNIPSKQFPKNEFTPLLEVITLKVITNNNYFNQLQSSL